MQKSTKAVRKRLMEFPYYRLLREAADSYGAAPSGTVAVTLGLILVLTAPTLEMENECADIVAYIADRAGLTEDQVERCKVSALLHAEMAG